MNMTWAETETELEALSAALAAINETPRKEQSTVQTMQLQFVRYKLVALHYERIRINCARRKQSQ